MANVAVADPTAWSRIIHAWPSFALIGAYELLLREFRTAARSVRTGFADDEQPERARSDVKEPKGQGGAASEASKVTDFQVWHNGGVEATAEPALSPFQARAWRWALERQRESGELPNGQEIAAHFGRKERWGRLVKQQARRQGTHTGAITLRCSVGPQVALCCQWAAADGGQGGAAVNQLSRAVRSSWPIMTFRDH